MGGLEEEAVRVNVVANRIDDDWIIARLGRHLVDQLGWSWSKRPDKRADVNVFFPYLDWRNTKWATTPTAAWFTHKRSSGWGKAVWSHTANSVDLRITPARMYLKELRKYGAAFQIAHPVELDRFLLREKQPGRKAPIIGVAGTVYKDHRKGENLVADLVRDGRDVTAIGRGWPCPTSWLNWDDVPEWYRSLDIFLVTSTIEGGPVTVLEAMASGVPVVIPSGVGQCGEYPESRGIRHYKKGDINDLRRALGDIDKERSVVNPYFLRSIAEGYTIERYCEEWKEAICRTIT